MSDSRYTSPSPGQTVATSPMLTPTASTVPATAPAQTAVQAPTLTQRIERLAEKISTADPTAAARLKELGEAVKDHTTAHVWAFVNLAHVADANDLAARYATSTDNSTSRLRFLESIRNVLVFLPLVLTWFGIYDASQHFYSMVHDDPTADLSSFLFLWQSGFGGRTWLTLSHIALADVALLLGLVGFTLYMMIQSNRRTMEGHRKEVELKREIGSVLADADLALARCRLPQPYASISKLEEMVHILHEQIKAEREHIANIASQKEKELSILAAFTPQLASSSTRMLAAAERLEQAQNSLAHTLDGIMTPIQDLAKRQGEVVVSLRASTQQSQALQQNLQQIAKQLGEINRNQATLNGEIKAQIAQLTMAVSQMAPAVSQFGQVATDLAHAQTQLLQQLAAERTEQIKLTQAITQAGTGLEGAVARVNQDVSNVSALAAELGKLSRTLPTVVQGLERITAQQNKQGLPIN